MFKKYVKLLKENSIKNTPQRLEILRYLDEHRIHPTAEKIYSDLKEKNPSLSKTTVYNSLEIFKEHDIIQSLTISGSELRYDFENKMHHHFLCTKCGRIYDIYFKCPNIEKIRQKIRSEGHQIDEVYGHFKGICKACLQKREGEGRM
ncbi:MAG: Fur family transcriptional regulator [Petrotogales bacterium]